MNDIELTKIRQAELEKHGYRKGFPVWVCFKIDYNQNVKEVKTFFTSKGKDEYISQQDDYNYVAYLTYTNDIKEVSYKVN